MKFASYNRHRQKHYYINKSVCDKNFFFGNDNLEHALVFLCRLHKYSKLKYYYYLICILHLKVQHTVRRILRDQADDIDVRQGRLRGKRDLITIMVWNQHEVDISFDSHGVRL